MTGLARSREPHPRGSPPRARNRACRAALEALAAGRLNVESIGYDETLFAKAAAASNQSTALFSVISALVGFLFAFNAMLLTVPQRRRLVADLRRDGYTPRTVIAVLLLDAVALGARRVRARPGAGRGALDPPVPLQPRVPVAGVRGRLGARRQLAERRDRARRRNARRDRGGAEPAARHPLTRSARRDGRPARKAPAARRWRARRSERRSPGSPVSALATAILLAAPDAAIPAMVLLVAALLLVLPLVLGVTLDAGPAARPHDHERRPARGGDGAARRRARAPSRSRRPARSRSSAASRSRAPTATCSRASKARRTT